MSFILDSSSTINLDEGVSGSFRIRWTGESNSDYTEVTADWNDPSYRLNSYSTMSGKSFYPNDYSDFDFSIYDDSVLDSEAYSSPDVTVTFKGNGSEIASARIIISDNDIGTISPTPTPEPTPVPVPTPTPEPTPVPVPTPTPEPTLVPVPTPTPEPTPVPVTKPAPEPVLSGDPPNLLKATIRGKKITLQFDNIIADILPSKRKFTINQGNREFEIVETDISPNDGVVTLISERELDPTAVLTLDYLDFPGDQEEGVVQSLTGVDVKSFTDYPIENQGSQINLLTIDEGEFEGNQITLFVSAPISDATPSARRFKVKSANKKVKILDIMTEPDDGIIILKTNKNLDLQGSVNISYRDLSGDQVAGIIEDRAGNDMTSVKNFEIISGGNDSIAPRVESATLDGNILSVEFDSIIRNTAISKNRFKVKVNGKKVKVKSANTEADDSYVELSLQPKNLREIDITSSVTLSYRDPKGDQTSKVIEDIFGNDSHHLVDMELRS